jgi:ATP-dependent Clp protease adaptor protein ClpS
VKGVAALMRPSSPRRSRGSSGRLVAHVLIRFSSKNREDATRIMLHVHQNGVGECGVYTYETAESKVTQEMDFARKHQHPLQCVMEKK